MALLSMSKLYQVLPSVLLNIDDEYTAYCLNEACAYIRARVDKGEELQFERKYTSFADLYKDYQ